MSSQNRFPIALAATWLPTEEIEALPFEARIHEAQPVDIFARNGLNPRVTSSDVRDDTVVIGIKAAL